MSDLCLRGGDTSFVLTRSGAPGSSAPAPQAKTSVAFLPQRRWTMNICLCILHKATATQFHGCGQREVKFPACGHIWRVGLPGRRRAPEPPRTGVAATPATPAITPLTRPATHPPTHTHNHSHNHTHTHTQCRGNAGRTDLREAASVEIVSLDIMAVAGAAVVAVEWWRWWRKHA